MVSKKTFLKTIILIGCLFFIFSCSDFLNEASDITGSGGNGSIVPGGNGTTPPEPTVAFYLDPIDGLDTNDGTVKEAPIKTMTKAVTLYGTGSIATIIWVMDIIEVSSTVTFKRPVDDGKSLTLKRDSEHRHALINVTDGTLTLENITIDGNKADVATTATDPLITVTGSEVELVLNSGAILQNNNNIDNTDNNGGGVSVSGSGTLTINGGTITNNVAKMRGGGVSVSGSSTVTINDGEITYNVAGISGGGINVANDNTVNLGSGGIINISSNTKTDDSANNIDYNNRTTIPINVITSLKNGTKIGLNPSDKGYRANLVKAESGMAINVDYFTRDDKGGVAFFSDATGNYLIVSPMDVYLNTGAAGGGVDAGNDTADGTSTKPVKTMNRAVALLGGLGIISSKNIIYVTTTSIPIETDTVWNYSGLTLKRHTPTIPLIEVKENGFLTLENITIDGASVDASKPLIMVSHDKAELILNDGAILQNNINTTTAEGGGLHVTAGKVTINNGAIITKNENKNTASGGGGLHVVTDGTVTINGGAITNNKSSGTSSSGGGGLYVAAGTVTINGGEITLNESVSEGGGLHVVTSGTVTINDGKITGNKSATGGGLYVTTATGSGSVTINGGAITHNDATISGGGLYVATTGTVTINGGAITHNDATISGGGLHVVTAGIVKLGKGPISILDNTSTGGVGRNLFYDTDKPIEVISNIVDGTKIVLSPTLLLPGNIILVKADNAVYELDCFSLDSSIFIPSIATNKDLIVTIPLPSP